MPNPYNLNLMRLSDSQRLRMAGIWPDGPRKLSVYRDQMRRFQILCNRDAWLVNDRDGKVAAVAGFQIVDLAACRAVLHLLTGNQPLDAECIRAILAKAHGDLNLYRIELPLIAGLAELQDILETTGWRKEGCLAFGSYDISSQRHQDVILYSSLRPDYPSPGTAFVPFSKGIFALTGNEMQLQSTDFIRFGGRFQNQIQREAAEMLELLDQSGRLVERPALLKMSEGKTVVSRPHIPELVLRAALQAAEYFAGRRSVFEIPLDLDQGSAFQKRVWQKLSEIPYGSTWNYEELAYHVGTNDWSAARKMSRAVGSACGANPLPLIVPCHRVIGKDGRLVGFTSGLDIKEYLLDHEMMGLNE